MEASAGLGTMRLIRNLTVEIIRFLILMPFEYLVPDSTISGSQPERINICVI